MKYTTKTFALIGLLLPAAALAASRPVAPVGPPSLPPILDQAARPKAVVRGEFRDARGQAHPWSITEAHTLTWDGAPYLPVGGVFTPQSWDKGAGEDAWQADRKALDGWKAHGVLDVCLSAGQVGLTHVPVGSVQRVLDYLDANGFRYGVEIADFPKDPLVGYVIKPGVYRDPAPPPSGPARFGPIPGLSDAFYLLVSQHDGEVDETGDAQVVGGQTALVNVKNAGPDDVLLLYPQRLFFDGSPESHLPDLWQGYDEYRDRLLSFFRRVKLGPGFRFFLDPLTAQIGLEGEVENLVPTTDGFRMDFQAWLDRKYAHNLDDMNRGWGIADRSEGSAVPDFATAARCLPLWYGARGVPALYDPTDKVMYAIANKPRIAGHYWQDLDDFRLESTRGYMNAVADALRRGVADVPIVYQWTGHNALFSNDRTSGGYVGLSLSADGPQSAEAGAAVYAQAEESPQTDWILASAPPNGGRTQAGLFADWDALRDVGARGFFLAAPSSGTLDWLNAYAAGVQLSAADLAERKPRILPYPSGVGLDLGTRRLSNGVWWLPSYRPGYALTLGRTLRGYALPDPAGRLPTYVVWSPKGTARAAQFAFGKDDLPVVTDSAGNFLKIAKKGPVWTLPVGPEPVLVSHVKSLPLPQDAASDAEKEAKRLLRLADDQKINTERLKQQLFYALNSIPDRPDNVDIRYDLIQHVISGLTETLRPYTWIEAESATKYTFDSLVPDPEASGGAYLSLDTVLAPPRATSGDDGGYRADYTFSVNAPGRYALWMAGSPLGTRDVSAFRYSVDGGVANEVQGAPSEGASYAGQFVWSDLGDTTLEAGSHTLSIVVQGRRAADDHYALKIDAFCLSRVPFHPDGVRQPEIDTLPPPAPPTPGKAKH